MGWFRLGPWWSWKCIVVRLRGSRNCSSQSKSLLLDSIPWASSSRVPMSHISGLLDNARRHEQNLHKPLDLGVRRRLAIVTCMDSRVLPDQIFGLQLGDAEYIRNAGGRVTDDVIRSLIVSQELLHTRDIILLHHTDCGGQAVVRHAGAVMKNLTRTVASNAAYLVTHPVQLVCRLVRGIFGFLKNPGLQTHKMEVLPIRDLDESVREDVRKLRLSLRMPRDVNIYGFVYVTHEGRVREVVRDAPRVDYTDKEE
ncbi:hypothetical protein WJX72_001294 [[Myrmecia] bisecta]|uniref:Carbonic anhydrase n=1 Tax=[Myrmecia] bisecta TaxID=41462 RepID=A0AAW1R5V5_9CHLO